MGGGGLTAASPWTALEWAQWLRRKRSDPLPSWQGLKDAADVIEAEVVALRAEVAALKLAR